MIDVHSLQTLEFPKVLALIAGQCITPYGRPHILALTPLHDRDEIDRRQAETAEMIDIVTVGAHFPLYRMEDAREILDKSTVEGIFLDPEEIRVVLELLEVSSAIRDYDQDGRENFPRLKVYLDAVRAFPDLRREIVRTIDERGEIKDSASSALKRIRLDMAESKRRLLARLHNILGASQKQTGWQDDVITRRNGRYVIPVAAGQFDSGAGIVHDRSQSGATFFIEPKEVVEANNHLNLLQQEERLEIDRILRALTAEIALREESLSENIRLIGLLDSFHAVARFARDTGSRRPVIENRPGFTLIDARHPLLVYQVKDVTKVVPLDLEIGDHRQAVLVTGPNTGGKTIALKTVGLLVLMAQSGLPIPAHERSRVGIFRQIYADIGDEQSIELSLSTFSSHIRNIIQALHDLSEDTLVLFDEIGAGTDPKEGAALAESIILYALSKQARLIVTTHYSQLKTLPLEHPEIENASLEFNRETLAPTFRLQLGIPGSSYAVEIASRLGMPDSICTRASSLLGEGERSLANLISSLESELSKVKEDKKSLTERLAKATELEQYYKFQSDKLKEEIEADKKLALAETEQLLDRTRRETEQLVAEIRKTQAAKGTVKKLHQTLRDRRDDVTRQTEKLGHLHHAPVDPSSFEPGDRVRIISLDQTGEIEELLGDKARVRLGQFTTTAELRNLEKLGIQSGTARSRRTGAVGQQSDQSFSPEIHLRGMTVEEAIEELDRFLDKAVVTGVKQVYVIHGKGTGTLRRTLTEYLKKHPEVAGLRLGNWNEGGAGVTIVKLKE
jgi:DNA mismatch repair protein MutS2